MRSTAIRVLLTLSLAAACSTSRAKAPTAPSCTVQCGTACCAAGQRCRRDQCVPCVPRCEGRVCGPDGCGGRCQPDACGAGARCDATGASCRKDSPLSYPLMVDPKVAAAHLGVSVGLPFERGAVADAATVRIEAGGVEVPAQYRTLATWGDGSLRFLLASFLPVPGATYTVRHAPDLARSAAPPAPVTVSTADPAVLQVTTGGLSLRLRKTELAIEQVTLDGARLLSAPTSMAITDALAGGAPSAPSGVSWTVEDAGPVLATLRASGRIAPIAFEARLSVWSGGTATLDVTLIDPRPEANVEAKRSQLALSLSSWTLTLPLAAAPDWHAGGDRGKALAGAGAMSLRQLNTINHVNGELLPTTFGFSGSARGEKAAGWLDAGGVTVALRDFWRAAPSGFALGADGKLAVELFPPVENPSTAYPALDGNTKRYLRPNTLYSPLEGMAKTRSLLLRFHPPAARVTDAAVLNEAWQEHRPRAWASARTYAQSGALVPMREAGPWSAAYDSGLISGIIDRSYDQVRDSGGLTLVYTWRDYGDRMRGGWAEVSKSGVRIPGFYVDTHVGSRQWFHQWARTLDWRWYEIADIGTLWFRDLGVSHANRAGYWHHAYGPGEAMVVKHEMVDHSARNIHPGHAHASGLADRYLMTGDRRDLEVLREIGDWWTAAQPDFFPLPVPRPHGYAEAERDYAWPLYTVLEAYRGSGDVKYLDTATRMVSHLIGWWEQPADHKQGGKVVGRNDPEQGTGYWTMSRADNCGDGWTGSNPWMAGALLNALILYREAALESGRAEIADPDTVRTMVMQGMNYVTRWGYQGKPSAGGFFRYAECVNNDGGQTHLLTPVAWCLREFKRGVPHPEWYDQARTWEAILDAAVASRLASSSSTAAGFYGYEETFAPSYFPLMKELGKLP